LKNLPSPKNIRTGQAPPLPEFGRLLWTAPNLKWSAQWVHVIDIKKREKS